MTLLATLGIDLPIIQAPMAGVSSPAMAAAVSNAGALGSIGVGATDAAGARAGLHPAALELLAQRRIGVLGSDSNNDTAPSAVEGVDFPVHVLAINAMGLHLLDYLEFEDLVALCEELRRWSFLCVLAPLRLPAGTGSPINPIAIF